MESKRKAAGNYSGRPTPSVETGAANREMARLEAASVHHGKCAAGEKPPARTSGGVSSALAARLDDPEVLEQVVNRLLRIASSESDTIALRAIQEIMDRTEGKPAQHVIIEPPPALTPDEIIAKIRAFDAAHPEVLQQLQRPALPAASEAPTNASTAGH